MWSIEKKSFVIINLKSRYAYLNRILDIIKNTEYFCLGYMFCKNTFNFGVKLIKKRESVRYVFLLRVFKIVVELSKNKCGRKKNISRVHVLISFIVIICVMDMFTSENV